MARELNSLTVVAPFHNEEANVQVFYEALTETLDRLQIRYDLIFVDDGSRDSTLALLNQLADSDRRVSVLSLARNFGHQAALTAGLDQAAGEAVIMMDSDLQHPPQLIPELIQHYQAGAELVYAVRREAENLSFFKRRAASTYYGLFRRMANVHVIPGAADFRLMSQNAVAGLREMREVHRFLRGMIPWMGFPHAVVPYDQPDRYGGQPSYTWRKSLRLARHGLFSFSTIPLELIAWLGIIMTSIAAVYLVYILFIAIFGQPVPGWSSVIIVTLMIGGVQLISLGVLAQYIGMIFEQVKERPLYLLKQKRLANQPSVAALQEQISHE